MRVKFCINNTEMIDDVYLHQIFTPFLFLNDSVLDTYQRSF